MDDREYEIRIPIMLRELPDGSEVAATPIRLFNREKLEAFQVAETKNWSLARARERTPYWFTPGSMQEKDGFRHDELARVIYRDITPPKFWDDIRRRRIPLNDRFRRVLRRWWRKRNAQNRKLDLAAELRAARAAHGRLRRAFGGWVRRNIAFDAERREQWRLSEGEPVGFSVREEWQRLERSLLLLVDFDRSYLWTRFGLFAMRFAECTPYADRFFARLVGPLKSKGAWSRIDHLNGARWELCLRAWNLYWDIMGVRPYREMRRLLVKVILNYDFLERGTRGISPESVRAWLKRNGW